MSPCSGDPGSYPEDGSSLGPPLLEDTSLHTAIDLKKRTEAASNKLDQVICLKFRAVPGAKDLNSQQSHGHKSIGVVGVGGLLIAVKTPSVD